MTDRLAFATFQAPVRRKPALALCLTLCALRLGFSATAYAQTIITFDAPGAGTAAGQGTFAYNINPAGTVAGLTRDTNWVRHAFLRNKDGSFTIFDAPGAGTCTSPCGGPGSGPGTRAFSINAAGTITGWWNGNSGPRHGYVRTADGTFTSFDAPDAGTGPAPQGTTPFGDAEINPAGAVTGFYVDFSYVYHGFVRAPDGTIAEFDPAGSIQTVPVAINPAGAITGYYVDASIACHGFVRAPDGTIKSFDPPGTGSDCNQGQGTFPSALLPTGAIEGNYVDSSGVNHCFVGAPGAFATFDVSVAGTGIGQGTLPANNNTSGAIVGFYIDASNANHGFLRSKQGAITTFDAPGAGTAPFQGTLPLSNNPRGAITGQVQDGSDVVHGFLRTP
jgi:hypothetical protein